VWIFESVIGDRRVVLLALSRADSAIGYHRDLALQGQIKYGRETIANEFEHGTPAERTGPEQDHAVVRVRWVAHPIRNPLVQCDQDPSLGGGHGDYFGIRRADQILLTDGGGFMT
jgi:hypothetical protein